MRSGLRVIGHPVTFRPRHRCFGKIQTTRVNVRLLIFFGKALLLALPKSFSSNFLEFYSRGINFLCGDGIWRSLYCQASSLGNWKIHQIILPSEMEGHQRLTWKTWRPWKKYPLVKLCTGNFLNYVFQGPCKLQSPFSNLPVFILGMKNQSHSIRAGPLL